MSIVNVTASPTRIPKAVINFENELASLNKKIAIESDLQKNREISRNQNLSEFYQTGSTPPLQISDILTSSSLLSQVVSSSLNATGSTTSSIVDGQRPQALSPDTVLLLDDPTSKVRFPDIIATDGYLNDPIQVGGITDFYPKVISLQISGAMEQYSRDIAQFVIVTIGKSDSEVYSIPMTSPIYDRNLVTQIFNSNFSEL